MPTGVTSLRCLADKGIPNTGWDYVHAHPHFFDDAEVELHYRVNIFRNRRFLQFIEANKEEFFCNKVGTVVKCPIITQQVD